jgi:nuclear transcription Y subunit beta
MDKSEDLLGFDDYDETAEDAAGYREVEIREQDRYLPIANIARIMKRVLPGNAKIAKDAKESIQACVSEYISFITSEASDKCQLEKRKTINGDDLLWAMGTLGFEQYGEPLRIYLAKYRESVKGERPEKLKFNAKDKGSVKVARQSFAAQSPHDAHMLPNGIYDEAAESFDFVSTGAYDETGGPSVGSGGKEMSLLADGLAAAAAAAASVDFDVEEADSMKKEESGSGATASTSSLK